MNLLRDNAKQPIAQFLFAHGAGAGKDSEFMTSMAQLMAEQGVNVIRFDFAYMQTIAQTGKRRPPDPMKKLQQHFHQQIAQCDAHLPLFIGGKSMGGRVASMILEETDAMAAVCFGYPFHPPGKADKLRVEHLQQIEKPVLVLQGARDTFGNQQEIAGYSLSPSVTCQFFADGDHSLKPRKASGMTQAQHITNAAKQAATFIQQVVERQP